MTFQTRRRVIFTLFLLGLGVVLPCAAKVLNVDRIGITVSDLGRTEAFYRDGLGFRTVRTDSVADSASEHLLGVPSPWRTLTMELGGTRVEFIQFQEPGRPYPEGSRSPDLCFQHFAIVVSDMPAAYARLRSVHFAPISVAGPQTLPDDAGRVEAFKFRDPDGHPLELIYFPIGQGRMVWHGSAGGAVTLGIDHTAIGISSTQRSKAFYQTLLGMGLAYEVVNQGEAQERLDGTFGAMVRITGVRPDSPDGPGIEFLDYRSPSTGRPAPFDARANDVWHVHVVMKVDHIDEMTAALELAGTRLVSPGIVSLPDNRLSVALLDPDGHTIVLEE